MFYLVGFDFIYIFGTYISFFSFFFVVEADNAYEKAPA